MKYVKFTKIDSETGISCNIRKPKNGEIFPTFAGLKVIFQDENITEFWYGTANDDAAVNPENQSWIITKEQFTSALSASIEKLKGKLLIELSKSDKAIREELLGVYHNTALIAGTYKYTQAQMLISGLDDPNDMLHLEATTRGIDPLVLANRIVDKYNKYVFIDALIAGIRGKLEDRIENFVVDQTNPIQSLTEFHSTEDIGNGTLLAKYGTDIYGRMIPLLKQGD